MLDLPVSTGVTASELSQLFPCRYELNKNAGLQIIDEKQSKPVMFIVHNYQINLAHLIKLIPESEKRLRPKERLYINVTKLPNNFTT